MATGTSIKNLTCHLRSYSIDTKKISIIIPVLNEARTLAATLAIIQTGENIEAIAVDGGSQDHTIEIAQSFGVKVLLTHATRATQMNLGAKAATGDILLFLHADTRLPASFDKIIRIALDSTNNNCPIAGAFQLQIEGNEWSLRLVEIGVNWRSQFLQMPYGDQAIFLKLAIFNKIGGFPHLPIMEDFELMRRLRRKGTIAIISTPVITSGRRWHQLGVLKTTLINQLVILAYLLKVPPQLIASWYRRK